MTSVVRRLVLGLFLTSAVAVSVASAAWGHGGSHVNANPWFCKSGVTNCFYSLNPSRVGTNTTNNGATHTLSFYSMLGGAPSAGDVMSANTDYTLRYASGNHGADDACENVTQGTTFTRTNGADAIVTPGTTGSWSGKGPVSMPAAGVYTICANATASFPNAGWSNHYYPFYVT